MPLDLSTRPGSSRAAVDLRRFPGIRKLAADYVYDFERLAQYFSGNPAQPAAWADAIRRVQSQRSPQTSQQISNVLSAQLRARQAPRDALAGAERLRDPQSVAIVTGQQAGLFGGPLFTLLKALTTLQLAERVGRDHGVTAIPVFWVDAEDHDWAEIGSCGLLDANLDHRTVVLPPPAGAGERPVASLLFDQTVTVCVAQVFEWLQRTEFSDDLAEAVRRAYQPGRSVTGAFAVFMDSVLGERGLVVFDSSDPAAKPLAAEVFAREIEQRQTASLAAQAGRELAAMGYHAQVTPVDTSLALFHLDGGRRAMQHHDGGVAIAGDREPRSLAALAAKARHEPVYFSPNVLLRPIVQDTLFPTVSYVAGPNELAYLGQLRRAYESFGVPMPLIYPRATATLVDSATAKFLARYHVALESLPPRDDGVLNQLLERELPESVERSLAAVQAAIDERMAAVVAAVPAIDPTLEGAARSTSSRLQQDLRTLHGKIIQAAKRRDDTLRRQFNRARSIAFPGGHPQERALAYVYFLNQYGPVLVERLLEELPLGLGQHWVLTI